MSGRESAGWRLRDVARGAPGFIDVACIGFAALPLAEHRILTHDTWWHLALGRATLQRGTLSSRDELSHTALGELVRPHAWLSDLIAAVAERLGGLLLVEALCVLLIALTLRVVYSCARQAGATPPFAGLAMLAFAIPGYGLLIARPQLVTYYLSGALLLWVLRAGNEWRPRHVASWIAWPLLFALWSNLHGGFVLGLAFLVGLWAGETVERWWPGIGVSRPAPEHERPPATRWLLLAGVCALAATLHPFGPGQYLNALRNTPLVSPVIAAINEWTPPVPWVFAVLAPLVGVGAIGAFLPGSRARPIELGLFGAGSAAALRAMRNVPLFGIFAAPFAFAWLSRAVAARGWLPERSAMRRVVEGAAAPGGGEGWLRGQLTVLALGVLLAGVLLARNDEPLASEGLARRYPTRAATWIEQTDPPGEMFNTYEWGGFLLYRLGPEYPVYIDSRMVPYLPQVALEYASIVNGRPGWERRLAKRGIGYVVVPRRMKRFAALRDVLREDDDWALVYEDERTWIWALSSSRLPSVDHNTTTDEG